MVVVDRSWGVGSADSREASFTVMGRARATKAERESAEMQGVGWAWVTWLGLGWRGWRAKGMRIGMCVPHSLLSP
jgi:hypothetical protein